MLDKSTSGTVVVMHLFLHLERVFYVGSLSLQYKLTSCKAMLNVKCAIPDQMGSQSIVNNFNSCHFTPLIFSAKTMFRVYLHTFTAPIYMELCLK